MLLNIILATTLVSALSLVAVLLLSINKKLLSKITEYLVALSAGTMIGTAFVHLIPEAIEMSNMEIIFVYVLASFIIFFLVEKLIHWHHCHRTDDHGHVIGKMNLIGDAIHNFIDGIVVAASFVANPALGSLTAFAVATHELPQEIGDFGVLIHSGMRKKKAIILNVLVSATMILGGIVGFYLTSSFESILPYLMAFAAGGFIYISASDLIPELKEEGNLLKSLTHLLVFVIGILITYMLGE